MGASCWFLLSLCFTVAISQIETRTCTTEDISGDYTRCLSLDGTRALFYYYEPGCNTTGAPALPPPVNDVPCNIECDPGEYLPLGSSDCETCVPGTFSLGGGSRFHKWTDNFPKTTSVLFKTYCSHSDSVVPSGDFPGCGWTLDGYETSSGDLSGLDSVNSILDVSFVLLEAGSVGFYYMCDVETEGDVFVFKLDDDFPVGLPATAEYSYHTIPVSAGTHKLRWIYYKNPQVGTGQDIARIADVEIYGISAADDKNCSLCPPGYAQPYPGQDTCIKCTTNTFAAEDGSVTCEPCVNGYSYEGASSCTAYTTPCVVEESAVAHYTECSYSDGAWSRIKYWTWEVPLFCDPEGVDLPDPEPDQACAPCPPGSYNRGDSHAECKFCNSEHGEYSSGSGCSTCEPGTVAIPETYYSEWDSWPEEFATYCYGRCSGDGWQLYHDSIRASLSPGAENDLLLTVTTHVNYGGALDFSWRIHGDFHDSYFKVTIDGKVVLEENSGRGEETFDLSYGMHVLGFWAHGDGVSNARVDISTMTISGTDEGGASKCTPCPAGYYQPDSQQYCMPCSFGRFNPEEGATKCQKCEEDTYASRSGQTECTPCVEGTHSGRGAGYCQNPDCTFYTSDGEHVYNLSPYAGVPQYVENEEAHNGHFLVSYCGFLYDSDSECTESYACETYDDFNPFAPARDYLNWAHDVNFGESDEPEKGFSLEFTGGEAVGCDDGVNRTVTIIFNCESDVTLYTALEYSSAQSSACHAVFEQTSIYGCPVCTFDDFTRKEGDCSDGEMVVQYEKKKSSQCNGVVKDSVESCGDVTVGFGLAVVIVVVILVVVLLLLIAVGWFVLKHQRLKIKYSQLRASNTEMTDMDEDDNPSDE